MLNGQLTREEAIAFGEQMNTFGEALAPKEQVFLKAILCDAAAAPNDGTRPLDDAGARTFGELVSAIHQAYLSPTISLNPQPIPSHLASFTDARHDRR